MAKKLGFDLGKFRDFVEFYQLSVVVNQYGGHDETWTKVLSTRGSKIIKNRTSQAQSNAGEWDFFQVYNFVIRSRSGLDVKKDMVIYSGGILYVIRGFATLDYNPLYIEIFTSTINDSHHALWDIINTMPIDSDKPNIIVDES